MLCLPPTTCMFCKKFHNKLLHFWYHIHRTFDILFSIKGKFFGYLGSNINCLILDMIFNLRNFQICFHSNLFNCLHNFLCVSCPLVLLHMFFVLALCITTSVSKFVGCLPRQSLLNFSPTLLVQVQLLQIVEQIKVIVGTLLPLSTALLSQLPTFDIAFWEAQMFKWPRLRVFAKNMRTLDLVSFYIMLLFFLYLIFLNYFFNFIFGRSLWLISYAFMKNSNTSKFGIGSKMFESICKKIKIVEGATPKI